jgi:heptosyltransferase-1
MPERRFLVVRLGSLGDIVHTFPAVAALRQSFADAQIIWLTQERWKPLVASSGLASQIWATETRAISSLAHTIREIHTAAFDTSIDYQGLWKSASFPFLGRVPRRIGFSRQSVREFGVPLLYTDRVHATCTHVAEKNGELSQRAGAQNRTAPVMLKTTRHDDEAVAEFLRTGGLGRYIVLSPGGGWRSKCWPTERFGKLCQMIFDRLGIHCIVNYGPGEEALASQVRAGSGATEPLLFNGGLGTLMSLLRNAICVVGGDTGPLHLAVAMGAPVVAIFGPTNPARNGPYRGAFETHGSKQASEDRTSRCVDIVLRAADVITTHRRDENTHPAILEIQVDTVFEAVSRVVEACV